MPPLIGITPDIADGRHFVRPGYGQMVTRAGGIPVVLSPDTTLIPAYINRLGGFVLTGGDDPIMERWGAPTHPKAAAVDPARQDFELALLDALVGQPDMPVLGICLGMQYMALHAGGAIDQHLPETDPGAATRHWGKVAHTVRAEMSGSSIEGEVLSHHRQIITDPGSLTVCARAVEDEVIEGIKDADRPFYIGVQWHPERTDDGSLGLGLFKQLVSACGHTGLVAGPISASSS